MLKGNFAAVKSHLKEEMHRAAEEMRFEQAQQLKEKLALFEDYQGKSTVVNPAIQNVDVFSIADDEISSALANLPQLLSQARAVPYFRNGTSIGMRLFAIKPESLYEKLGLKNGDIILSVNENSLSDPAQALKLFEQLKTERAINVKLERNSQVSEMRYSIR